MPTPTTRATGATRGTITTTTIPTDGCSLVRRIRNYGGTLTRQWFAYFNPSLLSGSQSGLNFDLLGLVSKAVEVYQKLNGEED